MGMVESGGVGVTALSDGARVFGENFSSGMVGRRVPAGKRHALIRS